MIKRFIFIVLITLLLSSQAPAKQVYVESRGPVETNNGHFVSYNLKPSIFVQEIYYDSTNKYLIANLNSIYHHYCGIPENMVESWVGDSSMSRFYTIYIKNSYVCSDDLLPQY